jgi:hypothetical protein
MRIDHPDTVLENLISTQHGKKKVVSLKRLHTICRHQYASGSNDFSIGTISRICAKNGLFSEKTLFNSTSSDYRTLIESWSVFAGDSRPKAGYEIHIDSFYSKISDPVLRSVIQSLEHERNKLKAQVNTLKSSIVIGLDLKDTSFSLALKNSRFQGTRKSGSQVLSLTTSEIEALEYVVSKSFLEENNLTETEYGELQNENGRTVLRTGFTIAIRKVLASLQSNVRNIDNM